MTSPVDQGILANQKPPSKRLIFASLQNWGHLFSLSSLTSEDFSPFNKMGRAGKRREAIYFFNQSEVPFHNVQPLRKLRTPFYLSRIVWTFNQETDAREDEIDRCRTDF